jgi:hypothetical protein
MGYDIFYLTYLARYGILYRVKKKVVRNFSRPFVFIWGAN